MGKINGSEAKLGVKVGVTHGTAIALGAGDGMCFESLEWNDNPEILEFNSKGCGKSMKNSIQHGFKKPNLTLTYHLKYGGNQIGLLAGFFGQQEAGYEYTGGQGDYLHIIKYASARKFFTIACQTSSATAVEWASCYPVSVNISASVNNPVKVTIGFLTSERNHSPASNTFAGLASVTETTTASYAVHSGTGGYFLIDEADGTAWATQQDHTAFVYQFDRPMEFISETYASVKPAPLATSLFTATLQIDLAGLEDHTLMNYQQQNKLWQTDMRVKGLQINSGLNEYFHIANGSMKYNADLSTSIGSDGINSASLTYELIYQEDTSLSSSNYREPFLKVFTSDTSDYV